MRHHYVYEIRNTINGMRYIGARSCPCEPLQDTGYMSSSKLVKAAISEIGKEAFKKIILGEFETRELAMAREIALHAEPNVDRDEKFYNLVKQTTTGFDTSTLIGPKNHHFGKHHTESAKQKISAKTMGRPSPRKGKSVLESTKELLRQFNLGKKQSEETKVKHRDAIIGKRVGAKHPMYGLHHKEESRQKTSDALLGKPKSDNARQNMSDAVKGEAHPFYGAHHSKESRERIRFGLLNRQPVVYITPIGEFSIAAEAARQFGCTRSTVIMRCKTAMSGWAIRPLSL